MLQTHWLSIPPADPEECGFQKQSLAEPTQLPLMSFGHVPHLAIKTVLIWFQGMAFPITLATDSSFWNLRRGIQSLDGNLRYWTAGLVAVLTGCSASLLFLIPMWSQQNTTVYFRETKVSNGEQVTGSSGCKLKPHGSKADIKLWESADISRLPKAQKLDIVLISLQDDLIRSFLVLFWCSRINAVPIWV